MEYLPVLILMGVGLTIGGASLFLSHFIGPRADHKLKDRPFECGVPPIGDARHRVSVRFYLVAILFLIFDVEAVFFYPWAIVFKKFLAINTFIIFEMLTFVGILLVGYFYIRGKKALEWD